MRKNKIYICICGKEFRGSAHKGKCEKYKEYIKTQEKLYQERSKNFNFICKCGEKFETKIKKIDHGKRCPTNRQYIKKLKEEYLTYDFMYDLIIVKKLPIIRIRDEHIIHPELKNLKCLFNRAKELGIKTMTIKESKALDSVKNRIKQTCLERYGDINVLGKKSPIYKKRNETIKNRYGVNNVFQIQAVIDKIKNDEHYIEKYRMTRKELFSKNTKKQWDNLSDDEKMLRHKKMLSYSVSKIEYRIRDILNKCNIHFETGFNLKYGNRRSFVYDILLNDLKLIIEVNGDYWHAWHEKYKNDSILTFNGIKYTAEEIWKKDAEKKLLAESKGYSIIYIWEHEMHKLNENQLKELVINKLNTFKESIKEKQNVVF